MHEPIGPHAGGTNANELDPVAAPIDRDQATADLLLHMVEMHQPGDPSLLSVLGTQMRSDSASWFRQLPNDGTSVVGGDPTTEQLALIVHYSLGLAGETGEVADAIKKAHVCGYFGQTCAHHADGKHSHQHVASELADVLTYLLLLADVLGYDLVAEYQRKRRVNMLRWGDPAHRVNLPAGTVHVLTRGDVGHDRITPNVDDSALPGVTLSLRNLMGNVQEYDVGKANVYDPGSGVVTVENAEQFTARTGCPS